MYFKRTRHGGQSYRTVKVLIAIARSRDNFNTAMCHRNRDYGVLHRDNTSCMARNVIVTVEGMVISLF